MAFLPCVLQRSINRSFLNLCRNTVGSYYWSRNNLFTEAQLGLDTFNERKSSALRTMMDLDKFKNDLDTNLSNEKEYLIYSDDLKKMIKICEDDDDIKLLKKMIERFNEQSKRLRFDDFWYGPEIIRLLHVLKRPREALELINNDKYNDIFLSYTCYLVVMDMLFKEKMYEDVVKVHDRYLEKQTDSKKYAKGLLKLYYASTYKIGTAEAYQKCLKLHKDVLSHLDKVPLKCNILLAMLALKHNDNYAALELVSNTNGRGLRFNVRVQVFALEKRYNDVLFAMSEFLSNSLRDQRSKNYFICEETLKFLEKEFENTDNEMKEKFNKLKREFKSQIAITKRTLEESALEPDEMLTRPRIDSDQNNYRRRTYKGNTSPSIKFF